ncbi:glycoside hydrolase family 65 protein [Sporolactobacillus nakayamae]|nr:glycoside hydrolase family 65 protein [Sporolactobacillus nakayamae]
MKMNRIFKVSKWKLTTHQLHKNTIRLQESMTSIGNGYMGMRGNFEETYSGDHHQGTYIAGVWYPDKTRVGWWKNGYPEYFGKVINSINLIGIKLFIDGEEVDLYQDKIENFYLELNMHEGVVKHSYLVSKNEKQVKIDTERFVSTAHKEICAIRFKVTALSDSVTVNLVPYLDADVRNEDSNYDEMFWLETERRSQEDHSGLTIRTIDNSFGVPIFSVCALMGIQSDQPSDKMIFQKNLYVSHEHTYHLKKGQSATLDKIVAVTTSRDYDQSILMNKANDLLDEALSRGYSELKRDHCLVWEERWKKADVEIVGDDEAQQGIRFNLFQLFSTYYGDDARLNIGPKGFTGEKYGGATYWDTEAYAVPFYLALADSHVTKQLLLYRYKQLDGAFHNAKQQGLKGALYPMVTFTGVECHNEWEITFEEIHRNGAIAYAIYNYVNYTGDQSYIEQAGIDVLVGISRFWADRVHFSEHAQKYMIHGVTGPNEYENNVNNNWYTNTMAAWTLKYTIDALDLISKEKYMTFALSDQEIEHWKDIVERMYYPYDKELGVFIQHDTFLDKDIKAVSAIPDSDRPINQHWSWDRILRSCYIKQADVLQGLYFLNDHFTVDEKKRNFDFYEPLTVHESSLSACVHAILAAELNKKEKALELYRRTARLDLDNYNNDTEDGLHITSMTGSWLAIVQGFAGMRTFNESLSFAPFLPDGWTAYTFRINYRGRLIEVCVKRKQVVLKLVSGDSLQLNVYGQSINLSRQYSIDSPDDEECGDDASGSL